MALQEFFKEVYRRFGIAWTLVILLLITSFLLLLCSFGKQSIIPETWIIDKDKFVSNDYYEDACYFTNIKDKPFTVGWFGLNPKEFVFQIYLSGFNHPIGYMPRTVKKRK